MSQISRLARATAVAALFTLPALSAEAQDTFVVSNWGYSNDFYQPYIFEPFEKAHDVKIVVETGGAPERLNKARIRGGVDVILLTDKFSQIGIDQGAFETIDSSKLSNFDELYEAAQHPQGNYGPAYTFGRYGIVYDKTRTDKPITSWCDLWRPEFANAIAMPAFNTTGGPLTVMMAGKCAGSDAFEDPDTAFKKMGELKPNIVKTFSSGSELTNLLSTGEAYIGLAQDYAFPAIQAANPNIGWAELSEGDFRMMNTYNIPKNAKHKDLALAFIDFSISQQAQKDASVQLGGGSGPVNKLVELTPEQSSKLVYGEKAVLSMQPTPYDKLLKVNDDWERRWNGVFGH
ncbi:ABC transporter substrate-binding protein [Martelella alba]|uniref:ABC transporter substrate-binding protein n=1 Tax=Martelella alba TaxID=2590451 RepID=A0A506U5J3_9HYPH|nr:ABC transporter substrate-binding protein [Martelella alba]TPW28235.1 ABC transporter substrate-binding protein [Martelella alba]